MLISNAFLALAVLSLDLAVGPIRARLRFVPGPPALLARTALTLTRRLDRPNRSKRTLHVRGALLVLWLGGIAALVGIGLELLATRLPFPYGLLVDGLFLWGCVRTYRPLARLRAGARRIADEADEAAYGRNLLEQTAISFVHFVMAPLFWFLLAGLPGLLVATAGWALERAAQENRGGGRFFGWAAVRLDRLLSWVPSRIAELVLAAASLVVPRGRPVIALTQGWGHARLGELGTVAAFAGGLGVALPGPLRTDAGRIWLGAGSDRIGRTDLLRAIWLYLAALLVVAGLLIATIFLQQS